MTSLIDQAKEIRPGEELDLDALGSYLGREIPEMGDAEITLRQFPSGHSNLTYLVRAGEREYVLRRPPFGSKVKSAHDMGREHRVLSKLHAVYPLAPEPLAFCEDESVMGAKFYVMRKLEGVIVRKQIPAALGLGEEGVRKLNLALVDNLARIHAVDYRAAGLGDLGKPDGYVERQVQGWIKRYEASRTDDIPSVDVVAKWLTEHRPAESGATLLHNDYKLDNLVLDVNAPTRIVGVLDWEMATIGDPLMDLGGALAYWIEAGDDDMLKMMKYGPTDAPGAITRRDFVARYEEASRKSVKDALYYFVFGCFKNAVIIQQIYYRYKQGLTKDERFSMIIAGVHILCSHAERQIERGTV